MTNAGGGFCLLAQLVVFDGQSLGVWYRELRVIAETTVVPGHSVRGQYL